MCPYLFKMGKLAKSGIPRPYSALSCRARFTAQERSQPLLSPSPALQPSRHPPSPLLPPQPPLSPSPAALAAAFVASAAFAHASFAAAASAAASFAFACSEPWHPRPSPLLPPQPAPPALLRN